MTATTVTGVGVAPGLLDAAPHGGQPLGHVGRVAAVAITASSSQATVACRPGSPRAR